MLGRLVDSSDPPEVREHITLLTVARLWANACYRFAPPFLAVIARDLDVSLDELGIALAISEVFGLVAPLMGRWVDHLPRRLATAGGLGAVVAGAALAGASNGRWMFAVALVILSQGKIVFDLGLGAWIADHVPFARRGRIVGITETSWALGLLVGVSSLGVATAIWSWRAGFGLGALAVVVMAVLVLSRLPDGTHRSASAAPTRHVRVPWGMVWRPVVATFALMAASQCVFVTFGAWLEDVFGLGEVALSTVTFLLGGVELIASITAARQSDRWGKAVSAAGGAAVMVPAMLVLATWNSQLAAGVVVLAIALLGFEFGIVSALPLGTQIVPQAPALGLGMMLGAGTLGRAITALAATRLYTVHGMDAPMALGGALAGVSAALFLLSRPRPLVAVV